MALSAGRVPVLCLFLATLTVLHLNRSVVGQKQADETKQCDRDGSCDTLNVLDSEILQHNINVKTNAHENEKYNEDVNQASNDADSKDDVTHEASDCFRPENDYVPVDLGEAENTDDDELEDEEYEFNGLMDGDESDSANGFVFPKLSVIEPGHVGQEVEVELDDGRVVKRITRAIRPPVFTIPNFLTDEECDWIMSTAQSKGLDTSMLFGDTLEDGALNGSDISRISQQTWLYKADVGENFAQTLKKRVSLVTQLSVDLIHRTEPMQVVAYRPGGHYHAHLDTAESGSDRPCCFQTRCGEKEETDKWDECCRLCRFMTVLYYLNDVEEGGETAFPLADLTEDEVDEKFEKISEKKWHNLSLHCHDAPLVVKPKKGMAVMWYNAFVDKETGYMGESDRYSNHGGCDLIKGQKWIANTWISAPSYDDRHKESLYYGVV